MVIRVNSVPLDNPSMGWIFRKGSVPYSGADIDLGQVSLAGRDGTLATATTIRSPMYPLVVNTAPSGWPSLLALFTSQRLVLTRDDAPGLEIPVRLASSTPDRVFDRNKYIDATFLVELTGAFWRDQVASTTSVVVNAASKLLTLFPAMSAPIADAVLRVQGAATGIQITDAAGSWVTLPNVAAGSWVRFESATGKAFVTTTDVWTGGTDVSGAVDFGGPRGVFEITPVLTPLNPSDRRGELTITTASRTGTSSFAVRGKSAQIL
ncbi:hypothetical protein [Microbacterium sp. K24]|uniref:hypothetical protein n=1 Tax=Microbacterium sp. K24 TaxID=2305446 RepID=UPI00109CA8F4|nr:hypothetical protein [Microbacterium sp. K24]